MKIHTSLHDADIQSAARRAGVTFERFESYGSRSHARAVDVILAGSSGRQGMAGGYQAATWDEWGIFLAGVFRHDENAKCTAYANAADFHWQTDGRYRWLTLSEQHPRHKWEFQRAGWSDAHEHSCECGAVRRQGHLANYLAREGGNVFDRC